jgi:hypothetical protein
MKDDSAPSEKIPDPMPMLFWVALFHASFFVAICLVALLAAYRLPIGLIHLALFILASAW